MQGLSGFQNGLIAVYARILAAANRRQMLNYGMIVKKRLLPRYYSPVNK